MEKYNPNYVIARDYFPRLRKEDFQKLMEIKSY